MTRFAHSLRTHFQPRRGAFRLLSLLGVLAMVAAACQTATISATNVAIVVGHDEGEFNNPPNPDEPYLAIVQWRTKPGQAGSSSADVIALSGLGATDVGSSVAVPGAVGEAKFTNISPLTLAQLNDGKVPEIIGTVTVAFDADNASTSANPDPLATPALSELAADVEQELVDHFESLTPNTGSSPALAGQLNTALGEFLYDGVSIADHIDDAFAPLSNDDFVGSTVTARVVVDTQLSQAFSGFGNSAVSPDNGAPLLSGTTASSATVNQGAGNATYNIGFSITG